MPRLEQALFDLQVGNESSSSIHSTITVSEPDHASKTRKCNSSIKRKNPHTNKRGVTFNPSVRVLLINSHTEISKRRKKRVWYSLEEAKNIRNNALRTVRKMAKNEPLGPDETTRGLESKTPKEHRARHEHIQRTILVVLKEQDRWGSKQCIDSPSFDHDYVAALYRHNSRQCVSEAIQLAAMNAEDVWTYVRLS